MAYNWDTAEDCAVHTNAMYAISKTKHVLASERLSASWNLWGGGASMDHLTIEALIEATDYLSDAIWYLYVMSGGYEYLYALPYFMKTYGGVTWQAICEAWAKDDFAGRAPTIAFIDRMRQLIWDEPFSVRWAAKPEEQGLI